MAIQEGDKIPSVTVKATDMSDITTDELFGGKKVVLFAVKFLFIYFLKISLKNPNF